MLKKYTPLPTLNDDPIVTDTTYRTVLSVR
jgi:hypothetical protein